MPKRTDLHSILVIGSGPIIIGQACEFDYSGTQACKALREEGFRVLLINSNPATIMTDPEIADRTYIEPVTPEFCEQVIALERPDAILPTLGGQTGLNTAIRLCELGILRKYGVQMLGATEEVIRRAEDRKLFKACMQSIGLEVPKSEPAYTIEEAQRVREKIGLPCVIRPSFTLGGTGGGIAYNVEEFNRIAANGLALSLNSEVLIEESVYGWKEFELEVMRDRKDNVVIICSIENFDPMGVHTGDSITVAPAQTLTDVEYQRMRDAAVRVIRAIGVETGGSNIQFAIDPKTGRMIVIEMNPRVSRSSALASKATGYPIAKIAAKLAVGYTLDEIRNDITRNTPASFEPTIDYCVVKNPRFAFEKFPEADPTLGVQMKSVGETMSIGRTFKEAFQKSIRSLEISRFGLGLDRKDRLAPGGSPPTREEIRDKLITPNAERLFHLRYAIRAGMNDAEIHELTKIDPWFLDNVRQIVEFEDELAKAPSLEAAPAGLIRRAKRMGFSDVQLATAWKSSPDAVRARRKALGIVPAYKLVDTCAAEFEAHTPYYYSTYEAESEIRVSKRKKIMILGGGPNRIGQGIEFDYCCCHAAFALKEIGYETIMVNSNPETVSTDYDTSDQLYFEPLTEEDVLNLCDVLKPDGVIVQLGGQTPLNLAQGLQRAGVPIIGTPVEQIDRAEDRKLFNEMILKLALLQPPGGMASDYEGALRVAREIGYPVLVRPSYVLGGRAMRIVHEDAELQEYLLRAVDASPERPLLIDKYIEDATEVDVDALADGQDVFLGGILEHIEQAGVHSGDAAMTLPPHSLPERILRRITEDTVKLARELRVKGLMNVQFAVRGDDVYILEVNPRASRTVPFVSKAIGLPLAKIATKIMVGMTLKELGVTAARAPRAFTVKESVFPFKKFTGSDIILGPEMRSTGEVMGLDRDFGRAYMKAEIAASHHLPTSGRLFISVKDADKAAVVPVAKRFAALGFELLATAGTARALQAAGIPVRSLFKIHEGRPNALDLLINGELSLLVNTPSGRRTQTDDRSLRAAAVLRGVTVITTVPGAEAAVNGLEALRREPLQVRALQDYLAAGEAVARAPDRAAAPLR